MRHIESFPLKQMRRKLCQGAMLSLVLGLGVGAQPGPPPEGHRGGLGGPGIESVSPRLMRELNLSPEQQRKMKEVHLMVQKRKIQMQSDKAMAELDLKNTLSIFPVNVTEAMKIGEKLAEVERKIMMLKVESWSQFLASLTAEQHKKLLEIQENLK